MNELGTPEDAGVPRRLRAALAAVLVVGAVARVLLVVGAPRFGYAWDHFDILGMGIVARQRGITRVYSATTEELPTLRGWVVQNGQPTEIRRRGVHPPNYPPLTQLVFWGQSWWLGASAPAFVANTPYSRFVTSVVPWLFELATAFGVAALARALTGRSTAAAAAGAVTWLAPPLMMNTALFAQYDALALAPAVFALTALLRGRWLAAGVAIGLGLLLKPQGLLMVPVAGFAALVGTTDDPARGPGPTLRRLGLTGGAAALTLVVGSAPWLLADGLAWIQRCYRWNLFEVLPFTTLEAFNVWYLVALVTERHPVYDVLSSTTVVAGLTRDAWGRLFLLAALVATAALCWVRRREHPALAVVLFAMVALWSVFMWPTRVHERYLLYCVPAAIAAAAAVPRLRPVVAVLLLVATMEHSWMVWRSGPSVGTFDRRSVERFHDERFQAYWKDTPATMENAMAGPKPEESKRLAFERQRADRARTTWLEWALTLLSLGAYAAALRVVATRSPSTARPTADGPQDVVLPSA